MTENELDFVLGERFKAYAGGQHLPDGLENRLLRSVRRRTLFFRIKLFGLVAVVVLATLGIIGIERPRPLVPYPESTLIASDTPGDDRNQSSVTGWMFLGCVREYFKRLRNGRRKEDDPDAGL